MSQGSFDLAPLPPKPMRIIVCGGREYAGNMMDFDRWLRSKRPTIIVHGACPTGADAMAAWWAKANGVPTEEHPADWNRHSKAAGPLRNQAMVDAGADLVIAFPGGRGTADVIARAVIAGIPVWEPDSTA